MMAASKNEAEWNSNCDKVKGQYSGGYPNWWYREIIMSGLAAAVASKWRVGSLT
jgi:hypothetical protein